MPSWKSMVMNAVPVAVPRAATYHEVEHSHVHVQTRHRSCLPVCVGDENFAGPSGLHTRNVVALIKPGS